MSIESTLANTPALADAVRIPATVGAAAAAIGVSGPQATAQLSRSGSPRSAQENPSAPPGMAQIEQAVDEVREALAPVAQNLLFSIDEDTGRTVVKVVDKTTDEVIRQIPSEEILAISKALDKLQGVLLQQKA